MKKKGFTLIEFSVIIAIICIVAAVMVPVITGILDKTDEKSEEVAAGFYTSAMQRFADEKAGDALLYPNLSTTGEDSEYSVFCEKSGHGMFPGYNLLTSDNNEETYSKIRREAVIAIKAFSDVKTLDGYYIEQPSKKNYQYVYYYLTGQVSLEDERNKIAANKEDLKNGIVDINDYWVYLSRDGGSGEAIANAENGTGAVFVQIRQYGTDKLLGDTTVTLRIGSELRTAVTGENGTVGFTDVSLGSVFVEAEKLGAVSFPDERFYNENGCITVKTGGYIGDSANNPYVITLKMGSLGSMGFYRRTNSWDGSRWKTTDSYITDDVELTSLFKVDNSREAGFARDETYITNAKKSGGRQELLTPEGKFLLYGPYKLRVRGNGFRDYEEFVVSKIYGIDNYKNNGAGEYSNMNEPYEYPIIMRKPNGKGSITGVITWERPQQPLKGTAASQGKWVVVDEEYSVNTRVVVLNKQTKKKYYSEYFKSSENGKYSYEISGLPDGDYSIYLETPYGENNNLDLSALPEKITIDGAELTVNAQVRYSDVDMGSVKLNITYDERGNNDPISGAAVSLTRLGSTKYDGYTTDDDGNCVLKSVKRGFYLIEIGLPTYIGTDIFKYRTFVDGDEEINIKLPIEAVTVTGEITGFKENKNPVEIAGSFDGLKLTFIRCNAKGDRQYSSINAAADTSGIKAKYSVMLVPGMYKIKTEVTCYKEYANADSPNNILKPKSFDFSLVINESDIKCHPGAKVVWKQDAVSHWQQCSKCETVFNKENHRLSAWTASGASGCYRYCTERNCNRTLDPVTAHDYRYKDAGSYAANCVKNGNKHYECSRCSYGKDESIPKTGHNYGAWTSDNDTTHTRRCRNSGCSASETNNHNYGGWYWTSRENVMANAGSYCYSTGTQRNDCTTCGHYKLNYPKVGHSIECFMMREYVNNNLYYNMSDIYTTAYFVTNSGRVYMRLGNASQYTGRQIWAASPAEKGLNGFRNVITNRSADIFKRSIVLNTVNSHYVSCANRPTVGGIAYYCYCPINHDGDPYRTVRKCGCANKPLGYVTTEGGTEIYPRLNPAWENPYTKNGRKYI